MTIKLRQDADIQSLPGYTLDALISSGESFRVIRARRDADRLPVVLKMPRPDAAATDNAAVLRREFEMLRRVEAPGVIRAHALEQRGHLPVLVLEDFGGESLDRLCKRRTLTLEELLTIAVQLAATLAVIHDAGLVHKDVNPSNIVYEPDSGRTKLIDFGLAIDLRQQRVAAPTTVFDGSLPYLSPEQSGRINRPLDHRSDFYSLGATLYELLLQRPLFPVTEPVEWLHCHIAKQPQAPAAIDPAVPAVLSELIMKLLAKSPDERYQSAAGLQADLQHCLDSLRASGNVLAFPLALRDRVDRLQAPTRLYGRDRERAWLLQRFERAAQGPQEIVLIAGYSGIGKTSLIKQLYRPVTAQRGHLVAGKFEQLHRNAPYSGFAAAMSDLVRQLLTEPEAQLAHWKARLLTTLGGNVRLVTSVIPELELIVGVQPEVPELPPLEAEQRFRRVFLNFIGVFCRPDHPLVMFLDDLQWADNASLRLLDLLAREGRTPHLLLIGAYRDNELKAGHPLSRLAERLREQDSTSQIRLEPLSRRHLTELLADMLSVTPAEVEPLADLIGEKTGGNPFFTTEFLKALQNAGLLQFDRGARRWRWDIGRIRAQQMTDNVVDLMTQKLRQLDASTLTLLELAACVGSRFSPSLLAAVAEMPLRQVNLLLREAVNEGLISLPDAAGPELEGAVAVFNHDRIQQAAYSLLDEANRCQAHLRIGRLLRQQMTPARPGDQLFEITDQLNLGAGLIDDADERRELCRLNLASGNRAKQAGAYPQALSYLKTGLALLAADAWDSDYELTLELHAEAAEAAYLGGRHEVMERLLETAFGRARTLLDRTKLYRVRISACIARGALPEAIAIAKPVLRQLGHDYPDRPTKARALLRLATLQWRLRNTSVEEIAALPRMTDPEQLAAMSIGASMGGAAMFVQPDLLPMMIIKGVEVSLRHGHSDISLTAYASYGMILAAALGQIERGRAFGEMALALTERLQAKAIAGRVLHVHSALVLPWTAPLRASLDPLRQAHRLCLDHGDFEFAVHAATVYLSNAHDGGVPLGPLADEVAELLAAVRTLNQGPLVHYLECGLQALLNLLGRSKDPSRLRGPVYDMEQRLPEHLAAGDRSLALSARSAQVRLSYHFGDYGTALGLADAALPDATTHQGMFCGVTELTFDSLVRLTCAADAEPRQRRRLLRQVARNQARLRRCARLNPGNFLNKYRLVQAEQLRLRGRELQAQKRYDESMRLAREQGFIQEEALAAELCGAMHMRAGRRPVGMAYLSEARELYRRWGAQAKVAYLERRFPQLIPAVSSAGTIHAGTLASVDIASLIKALKAIADEQVHSRMVEAIIGTAMEFAGAQRGLLILRDTAGKLCIEAESTVDGGEPRILQSQPVAEGKLPQALINYVARTQSSIVIDDALQPNGELPGLHLDPFVRERRLRSLLCLPLATGSGAQRELIGMLYLENNHASGVFTQERFDILEMIGIAAAGRLELSRKAAVDGLTELFNHDYFQNLLRQELAGSRRHGRPLALLLIDIDHFKQINDTWGHQVGDQVLRDVAQLLKSNCRLGDTVARYGGEEMAVILPGADRADAELVGERIRAAVESHRCTHAGNTIGVTVSLGLAVLDADTADTAALIGRADVALYRSKREGRNRLSVG